MNGDQTDALAHLNAVYTEAVNSAVAEDRMDLVRLLSEEFDSEVKHLNTVSAGDAA